jgi:tetratricopeptide (TPR) repeat protein
VKISKTKIIKSGKYSIFSIPNKESWDVILYSDTDLWGVPRDWDENKIVFKSNYQINKSANNSVKEMFAISFDNVTNNDVDMIFSWDDVSVKVNIVVPTRRIVSDNIKKVMGGSPSPSDYYSAAVYYKQENINMDTALKWINKAIDLFENPRFYQLRQQSLIMAANKKYSDAIAVAKESLRLSIEADNKDYVKMNKESISEWTNKL